MTAGLPLLCFTVTVGCSAVRGDEPTQPAPPIMDNSFYIEEAFNQEPRVVQHVLTTEFFRRPERSFGTSFTQEWPLWGETHQLSYTLLHNSREGNIAGIGDVTVAYRYQLATGDDWAAMAPTLAATFPTGDERKGLGAGVTSIELKLPVSRMLSDNLVTHWNIGASIVPGAGTPTDRPTLVSYRAGGSIIWLTSPTFNMMLESLVDVQAGLDRVGGTVHETQVIVSPGARFAVNANSLQIVPGLAVPLRFAGGEVHAGGFVYLSFEHPF